jgi:hypothetical protein
MDSSQEQKLYLTRAGVASGDVPHAILWGLLVAGMLLVAIFFGSNHLQHFDAALVPYTGACVFSAFGIGYRFAMWLRRPPTRKYWFRGWKIFFRPERLAHNIVRMVRIFLEDFFAQRFIEKRSHLRWAAHWLIAWGCILAAGVTFPLSFGWVHFENAPYNQEIYRAFVFGQQVSSFRLGTITAAITFNILDISAVMVLTGVALALFRRARDRGAISVQQFAQDMMPLLMLFAISIFQRPAQVGVQFYKEEGARGEQAACLRCGQKFASQMHVNDLKDVERALGINYELAHGQHYQDICPACRRKSLAMAQDGKWRSQGTRTAAGAGGREQLWQDLQ